MKRAVETTRKTQLAMPNRWRLQKWGDLATLEYGKSLGGHQDSSGQFPVFGTDGQIGWSNQYLYPSEGIIIGRKGAYRGVHYSPKPFFVIDTAFFLKPLVEFNVKWAYYELLTQDINTMDSGSAIPSTTRSDFYNLDVRVPPLPEQESIARILSDLDSKIELIHHMNKSLQAMGEAIYKHWLIDFEFPNEEGKPYKSSGGEMVYKEELNQEIPRGWVIRKLNEISDNFDSRRAPLSSRERETRRGVYPYYGATGVLDHVNDFIFDGTFVLMGEDGSVIDETGRPILQYVWGRFWVNNHAHVLQGRGISNELLYLSLKNTKVHHLVTGAVQPKINQSNMNRLEFALPQLEPLHLLENILDALFGKLRTNSDEIHNLTVIRDALLPKLMSGKIRVPVEVR